MLALRHMSRPVGMPSYNQSMGVASAGVGCLEPLELIRILPSVVAMHKNALADLETSLLAVN